MLTNSVHSTAIGNYFGKDIDMTLEPVFNNILSEKSTAATMDIGKEVDEFSQEQIGSIEKAHKQSFLPVQPFSGGFEHKQAVGTKERGDP